jgi:hypothetical protein
LVSESIAEKRELWREAWLLYHRNSPRATGEIPDDRFAKLACLNLLMRLSAEKDRITGLSQRQSIEAPATPPPPSREAILAGFIESLPAELKNAIIVQLRHQARPEQNP